MRFLRSVLPLFLLIGVVACAPLGEGFRNEESYIRCDRPRLSVEVKEKVVNIVEAKDDIRTVHFEKEKRPLLIALERVPHSTMIDYYYSLSQMAVEMNHLYLGVASFGDREWAKTAYMVRDEAMLCGYFTRKDDEFVMIYLIEDKPSKTAKSAFLTFQKTREMSDEGLQAINEQFAALEKLVTIEY